MVNLAAQGAALITVAVIDAVGSDAILVRDGAADRTRYRLRLARDRVHQGHRPRDPHGAALPCGTVSINGFSEGDIKTPFGGLQALWFAGARQRDGSHGPARTD